jgi:hypothetical protein
MKRYVHQLIFPESELLIVGNASQAKLVLLCDSPVESCKSFVSHGQ